MWGAGPGCGIWRRIGQGPREALLNSDLQSPERRLSQSVEALEAKPRAPAAALPVWLWPPRAHSSGQTGGSREWKGSA